MIVKDEDIKFAETIFLPEGSQFDKERLDIIACMESCDVIACPGSGKTTVLLSKLAIIEKYLPLENNKGICVLTHTNVGIEEIRNRLGRENSKLFSYPNFFGTIQSFVNRYLAIPFYENTYGTKIKCIDNMRYNSEVVRDFIKLPWGLRDGLEKKFQNVSLIEKIQKLRFDLNDDRIVDGIVGGKLYKNGGKTEDALIAMKRRIMEDGILCYDDAYWLAYKLLEEDAELIKSLISSRFAYVFIDEMQDTSYHQAGIIDRVFDDNDVVIQKFGDPNQAIYDSITTQDSGWIIGEKVLPISNSMRFSNCIAQKIKPLELHTTSMQGNSDVLDIQPIIISFELGDEEKVLPRFAEIIANKIDINKETKIKAIGRVGKKKEDKLSIPSYFPVYNRKKNTLKSYMRFSHTVCKSAIDPDNKNGVRSYKKAIMDATLKVLWLLKIKNENEKQYTEKSFLAKLERSDNALYDDYLNWVLKWCIDLKKDQDIKNEFKDHIAEVVDKLFDIQDLSGLDKYFEDDDEPEIAGESVENLFVYELEDGNTIEIDISTVHGVKGETHSATLYFETFFHNHDVEQIIDYLQCSTIKKTGKRLPETCKLAYVGMSRPAELLCVAARKEMIDSNKEGLIKAGWEIIEI